MGMMMGGNDFGLKVTGPLSSIIDVTLVVSGKEEKSGSSMSDGTAKTFYFNKPTTDTVKVHINYWADLREETATFGP